MNNFNQYEPKLPGRLWANCITPGCIMVVLALLVMSCLCIAGDGIEQLIAGM